MKYLLLFLVSLNSFANPIHYEGQFESISTSSPLCNDIFNGQRHEATHYISGPTHLTSVVYLRGIQEFGFFNKMTLVGRNDGWGNMQVTKEFSDKVYQYRIVADGLYDRQFMVLDFTVQLFKGPNADPLCTAQARFSAFLD